MTDPSVKRFLFFCEAKCNMVGNVYIYTNPQIAPLNLKIKKKFMFRLNYSNSIIRTSKLTDYLPYNSSYMGHEYCKQYANKNDKTIKCYNM